MCQGEFRRREVLTLRSAPGDHPCPYASGSRLGPYEILAPLGAGGMGEVYRARDPRLGREVAIKVLPAERLSDEARRRRFVQEARAASSLNHPNIVTIYEIEQDGDVDFIVMELVAGKSLDKLIPKAGMPLGDALRLAIPIADALARARTRAGIVHRDLKPANVVVSDDGVPKILDFGLAKLLQREDVARGATTVTEETAASPLSAAGSDLGHAGLHVAGAGERASKVDARSDVFSFGSVLYEMLTGRRAFAGASRQETLSGRGLGRAEAAQRDRAGRAGGAREADPALPAQGPGPALPAHLGREGPAAGAARGVGLARTAAPVRSRPSLARRASALLGPGARPLRGRLGSRGASRAELPEPKLLPVTTMSGSESYAVVLARRDAGGFLLGRRRPAAGCRAEQGHLGEVRHGHGDAPPHVEPRGRLDAKLVAGREPDRVRTPAARHRATSAPWRRVRRVGSRRRRAAPGRLPGRVLPALVVAGQPFRRGPPHCAARARRPPQRAGSTCFPSTGVSRALSRRLRSPGGTSIPPSRPMAARSPTPPARASSRRRATSTCWSSTRRFVPRSLRGG